MTRSLVLLPTYNEAANLVAVVEAILRASAADVLVLDDHSLDGAGHLADTLHARYPTRVHVQHRRAKDGLGRAYRDGYARALGAHYDVVLQMDPTTRTTRPTWRDLDGVGPPRSPCRLSVAAITAFFAVLATLPSGQEEDADADANPSPTTATAAPAAGPLPYPASGRAPHPGRGRDRARAGLGGPVAGAASRAASTRPADPAGGGR